MHPLSSTWLSRWFKVIRRDGLFILYISAELFAGAHSDTTRLLRLDYHVSDATGSDVFGLSEGHVMFRMNRVW